MNAASSLLFSNAFTEDWPSLCGPPRLVIDKLALTLNLSDDDLCDLEIGALERLAREKQLMVYKHKGFWSCMDTIRDMDYLNKLWSENKAQWKIW